MKIVTLMLILIAGVATADENSAPAVEYHDVCDMKMYDALEQIAPKEQRTVTRDDTTATKDSS